MRRRSVAGLAETVFGEEGAVGTEVEAQAMTAASATLALGVVVVSPLMVDLADQFAVSTGRVGLLITAFTAPPVVLIPVMGVLADRVGRKPVLVPGLVLYGLAGAAIGLATSFEAALALRVLQGVGFSAAMPLTITVLGDLYAGNREATVQGMRTAGNFISNLVGPTLAGVLLLASWRYPFALFLAALPIAAWAWAALPAVDPPGGSSLRGYVASLAALLRDPAMALVMASFLLRYVLFYGYLTYVSVLVLQGVGLSAVAAGLAVSIKSLGSIVGSTQVGRLGASWPLSLLIAGAFALSGAGIALSGLVLAPTALVAGALLLGVGDGVCGPVQKSLVSGLAPTRLRAGAISSASTFQNVGKASVPVLLAGAIVTVGPGATFVALGVVGGALGVVLMVGLSLLVADRQSAGALRPA